MIVAGQYFGDAFDFEQVTAIDNVTPKSLSAAKYGPTWETLAGGEKSAVPNSRSVAALVSVGSGAAIRWRSDGVAPTATVGVPQAASTQFWLVGLENISAFKAVGQAAGPTTLDVQYYR